MDALKCFMEKFCMSCVLPSRRRLMPEDDDNEEMGAAGRKTVVPEDVKEGHFAVFAVKGSEQKRFVVELGYLSDPEFLRLLEKAEEEFGFKQEGTLAVPCSPEELQRILRSKRTSLIQSC